jgi:hypothetical protein
MNVTLLTTALATPCTGLSTGPARLFVGVVNNSLVAQSCTVLIYDSVLLASGVVIASIAALGPSQIMLWPGGGRRLTNGCVAIASGAPGVQGIEIYTR